MLGVIIVKDSVMVASGQRGSRFARARLNPSVLMLASLQVIQIPHMCPSLRGVSFDILKAFKPHQLCENLLEYSRYYADDRR